MPAKVVVLEFNELAPHLTGKFIRESQLINFEKLRSEAATGVVDAVKGSNFGALDSMAKRP
jgi:hypothetical protein